MASCCLVGYVVGLDLHCKRFACRHGVHGCLIGYVYGIVFRERVLEIPREGSGGQLSILYFLINIFVLALLQYGFLKLPA